MILPWMVYAGTVALLFGLAALALERVVRQRGWPVRWLWAGALVGPLLLPAAMASVPALSVATRLSGPPAASSAPGAGGAIVWRMDPGAVVPGWGAELDRWLLAGWAAASAAVALTLLVSAVALRRRVRGWRWRTVDGVGVWVAPDAGPAVVGFLRSRIVLPEWILERSPDERSLVLAHESEHLRAGDPHLILGALLLAAAFPWNPAIWWQVRRLRRAVEVDCDARVLARGVDARAYGRVLLDVTEQGGPHWLQVAALSDSHSSLERRIRLMFTSRPQYWRMRAAGAGALAAALILAACHTSRPAPGSRAGGVDARVVFANAPGSASSTPSLPVGSPDRILALVKSPLPTRARRGRDRGEGGRGVHGPAHRRRGRVDRARAGGRAPGRAPSRAGGRDHHPGAAAGLRTGRPRRPAGQRPLGHGVRLGAEPAKDLTVGRAAGARPISRSAEAPPGIIAERGFCTPII